MTTSGVRLGEAASGELILDRVAGGVPAGPIVGAVGLMYWRGHVGGFLLV